MIAPTHGELTALVVALQARMAEQDTQIPELTRQLAASSAREAGPRRLSWVGGTRRLICHPATAGGARTPTQLRTSAGPVATPNRTAAAGSE